MTEIKNSARVGECDQQSDFCTATASLFRHNFSLPSFWRGGVTLTTHMQSAHHNFSGGSVIFPSASFCLLLASYGSRPFLSLLWSRSFSVPYLVSDPSRFTCRFSARIAGFACRFSLSLSLFPQHLTLQLFVSHLNATEKSRQEEEKVRNQHFMITSLLITMSTEEEILCRLSTRES